jgi:hypothetical protein
MTKEEKRRVDIWYQNQSGSGWNGSDERVAFLIFEADGLQTITVGVFEFTTSTYGRPFPHDIPGNLQE